MNPEPDDLLSAAIRATAPADSDTTACWVLLERAVAAGWVDIDDLRACAESLPAGNDRGYDEFGLQPYGEVLEVSLLDERYRCATTVFVDSLWAAIRAAGNCGTN